MRQVSVRLTEEECEELRALSGSVGARSVSGFIRSTLQWIIINGGKRVIELAGGRRAVVEMEFGNPPGMLASGTAARGTSSPSDPTGHVVQELAEVTTKLGDELHRLNGIIETVIAKSPRS